MFNLIYINYIISNLCIDQLFDNDCIVDILLINIGPVGIAAAAAIATGKRKGHPHQFETNPSRRKRQQTRLLR